MDSPVNEQRGLVWDLRQIYARLVGLHLTEVAEQRKEKNYAQWYNSLEDLKTIVRHKFAKPSAKEKISPDEEKYNAMMKEISDIANQYQEVWFKQATNNQICALIDDKMRRVEEFLYEKMDDGGMFGSFDGYDPDEI